jgi:hypothetical protein
MMSLVGFDDATGEFLVNDSEMNDGIDFRYKYATILNTIHDFNYKIKRATGPARAIFTEPKTIVKPTGSNQIYLVRDGVKHYIINLEAFKNHRLSWKLVKPMDMDQFNALELGAAITK